MQIIAKTQEDYVKQLKVKLGSDLNWSKAGLLRVFQAQTFDERRLETVNHFNNVGFTSSDGKILCSFAKQLKYRGSLSEKQTVILLKKMPKYARQLLDWSIKEGKVDKIGGFYRNTKND
jgi:hypothetical protein